MAKLVGRRLFMNGLFDTGLTPIDSKPVIEPLVNAGWKIVTDTDISGKSLCSLEDIGGDKGVGGMRWTGRTSLDLDQGSRAVKTGFVSITSPALGGMFTPYLNLDDYESLMLTLRKRDNRNYVVNLYPDSYIGGEMYQGYIMDDREDGDVDKSAGVEEITVKLPFSNFMLTKEGRVSTHQRTMDGIVRLQNVGFLLADGREGEFDLEILKI
eukprot:CAMPEP_0118636918 /NCGR_PEP_ID=MMETSP0785-20121206/2882_1 /TAXON_ID=91992 /ORGANISM="Bolidomonas pacifica, Strain CCMP 1866" /LENGTH=210 /DNA_ID=CAMNT_0006528083 /DNA_START=65 /DNA_END=694 /DNA_ORIENTATION=-